MLQLTPVSPTSAHELRGDVDICRITLKMHVLTPNCSISLQHWFLMTIIVFLHHIYEEAQNENARISFKRNNDLWEDNGHITLLSGTRFGSLTVSDVLTRPFIADFTDISGSSISVHSVAVSTPQFPGNNVLRSKMHSCCQNKHKDMHTQLRLLRFFDSFKHTRQSPVTNSMAQSPSWQANSSSDGQENCDLSWNSKVHYRVQKSPLLDRNLCHMDPVHALFL
jgi:hypothetical protein